MVQKCVPGWLKRSHADQPVSYGSVAGSHVGLLRCWGGVVRAKSNALDALATQIKTSRCLLMVQKCVPGWLKRSHADQPVSYGSVAGSHVCLLQCWGGVVRAKSNVTPEALATQIETSHCLLMVHKMCSWSMKAFPC